MKVPILPGVYDIVPDCPQEMWKQSAIWSYVESVIREVAALFGFQEIRTPIFERTELFLRGVGESTDVVMKEMYTFEDKGERSLTLRPEGTTGVMRAFVSGQLQNISQYQRLFYIGPMFRYERPQAGRYRQHHQFGVEVIGNETPEQDAELIACLYEIYRRLGLKNLQIQINSLGSAASRNDYKETLKSYLQQFLPELSEDSQRRFEKNPLRILDSKDPKDRELLQNAPTIVDCLDAESFEHFEKVKACLERLQIPYQVNKGLVRGLDYYNRTVFEIISSDIGTQSSIGGGGRYDGLLHTLGGPNLPLVGFATGLERLIQTMLKQQVPLPEETGPFIYLIPLGEAAKSFCFDTLFALRQAGVPAMMEMGSKKLKGAMQQANHWQSRHVAVVGDEELLKKELPLKKMQDGSVQTIKMDAFVHFCQSTFKGKP
ncbi:MAG: hisS [Chlamydiales bacterium]|jgi:histidyl-tRNA synthetase|nr:hisS [Chlamydiales bacterium]